MKKYLLTMIFAAAMISAATAQDASEEVQAAIKYARSIAYVYVDKSTPRDMPNPAFISYTGNGEDARVELYTAFGKTYYEPLRVSGKMRNTSFGGQSFITYAVPLVMLVPKKGSIVEVTSGGMKKFEVDTLTFNFEEGKYYTIDSRVDNNVITDFSIKETDTASYLAYQTTNPNRLKGTWNGEGRRLLTTFLNQYSFDGNSMKFEGESKNPKQTFVVEGKLMYNENTIIFFPESARHKGKEVKNFNRRAARSVYIWYYTLIDNELHIEGGDPFFIGSQLWVNTGNFQKIN